MIEQSVGRSSDDDELVIEKSLSFLRPWRIMQPFLLDSLIAFQTKSLLVASSFLSFNDKMAALVNQKCFQRSISWRVEQLRDTRFSSDMK